MANPLDIVIRLFAKGSDQVASEFDDVADAGERMGDSLENSARSMAKMEALEDLASAGEKLSSLGASATQMADGWASAAEEGLGIEQRLESILKAQQRLNDLPKIEEQIGRIAKEGHFDDDDELRNGVVLMSSYSVKTEHLGKLLELGSRQARTMGQSLEGVANQLGKAYSTGNIASLAKSGVVMSKQEVAAVKAAYGVSKLAGQMKFMEILTKSVEENTVGLNDSLTETQKRANDTARAWDDAQTSLGKGSTEAKANIQIIIGQLMELGNANPKLLESAGAMTVYGGTAATAAGSVLSVGSNLGIAVLGAKTLGITGVASMTALKAAALSTAYAVGLIAIAAYGATKAWQGVQDAKMGDEELEKKHGAWGKLWSKGGKWLGESRTASFMPIGWAAGNLPQFTDRNADNAAPIPPRAKNRQKTAPNGDTHVTFEPVVIKKPKSGKGFS